jgi:hypothetical protein
MMRSILFFLIVIAGSLEAHTQHGKYAGSYKKLIGVSYVDSRHIPSLKTWEYQQGSIASPLSDPEWFSVEIFRKGTTYLIFFSVKEDTATETSVILDVIELKGVQKGWEIKAAVCRENKEDNAFIVALVKPANAEYSTNVKKAWRFNRDKRRFEWVSVKTVDCLNEGFDNT